MADLIEGKVARILNSRELVINRGTEAGVKLGMRFAVLYGSRRYKLKCHRLAPGWQSRVPTGASVLTLVVEVPR
jgi:hypothetical protein